MKHVDLLIVGGGSAGMAAAIQAKKEGIDDILIVEKDEHLGGILNQCIHNGFGLTEFKEELTGPEYLARFVDQVEELHIPYMTNAMVIDMTKDKIVTISSKEHGVVEYQAKAIVMATGCYERGAGAIQIPGDRLLTSQYSSMRLMPLMPMFWVISTALVAGIGIAIEKGHQKGGKELREEGYHLESIAIIESMDWESQTIHFREQQ